MNEIKIRIKYSDYIKYSMEDKLKLLEKACLHPAGFSSQLHLFKIYNKILKVYHRIRDFNKKFTQH